MLQKHSKVGTFEGLFESSTFVYALIHVASYIMHSMLLWDYQILLLTCSYANSQLVSMPVWFSISVQSNDSAKINYSQTS